MSRAYGLLVVYGFVSFWSSSVGAQPAPPLADDGNVPKNRYLSVRANPVNAGVVTARRISLDTGGTAVVLGWVGEPTVTPGLEDAFVSLVSPTPVYRDWSLDETVHITGCQISPQGSYLIQAIEDGQDTGDESHYSEALSLQTVQAWGDVIGNCASCPPNGIADNLDFAAAFEGFRDTPNVPMVWLDLGPEFPDGKVDFLDILLQRLAFFGFGYPFHEPTSCPSSPPECGNDSVEGTEQCDDGNTSAGDGCDAYCQVEGISAGTLRLAPILASGVEGVDWELGPAPNEITLHQPGQDVLLEAFVSGFAPASLRGLQTTLACAGFGSGVAGSLEPINESCPLQIEDPFCNGSDRSREDYIFADVSVNACALKDTCGESVVTTVCGAMTPVFEVDDPGVEQYVAQYAVRAGPDAQGTFTIAFDPDPSSTFLRDEAGDLIAPIAMLPALISTPIDCNGNGVPDDVDIESGTSPDCNANDVPDSCDIDDGTSEDCTGDGTPDECEPDCNENGTADSCDIGSGTSEDVDGDGVPDECCFPSSRPQSDPTDLEMGFGTKNRYASFVAGDSGRTQAIRVIFTDLPDAFDFADGWSMWVGEPRMVTEASGSNGATPEPVFAAAELVCNPHWRDWSQFEVLHVYGAGVVPTALYDIQVIDLSPTCPIADEASFSPALAIRTSAAGDVVGSNFDFWIPGHWDPPQGVVEYNDISAVVDGFKNSPGAPIKAKVDVIPSDTSRPVPDQIVDFVDISYLIGGFRGDAALPPGPVACP